MVRTPPSHSVGRSQTHTREYFLYACFTSGIERLPSDPDVSLSPEAAKRRMENNFRARQSRPLFKAEAASNFLRKLVQLAERTPYSNQHQRFCPTSTALHRWFREIFYHISAANTLCLWEQRESKMRSFLVNVFEIYSLNSPCFQNYAEVVIPPAKAIPRAETERLVLVNELDALAQGSFPVWFLRMSNVTDYVLMDAQGYKSLNRIQSIVYPTAYGSNENMLVCGTSLIRVRPITLHLIPSSAAPTGAVSFLYRDLPDNTVHPLNIG